MMSDSQDSSTSSNGGDQRNERVLLDKLKCMLPTPPSSTSNGSSDDKYNKLVIIRNVIDYIKDLGKLADDKDGAKSSPFNKSSK